MRGLVAALAPARALTSCCRLLQLLELVVQLAGNHGERRAWSRSGGRGAGVRPTPLPRHPAPPAARTPRGMRALTGSWGWRPSNPASAGRTAAACRAAGAAGSSAPAPPAATRWCARRGRRARTPTARALAPRGWEQGGGRDDGVGGGGTDRDTHSIAVPRTCGRCGGGADALKRPNWKASDAGVHTPWRTSSGAQ